MRETLTVIGCFIFEATNACEAAENQQIVQPASGSTEQEENDNSLIVELQQQGENIENKDNQSRAKPSL